MTASRRCWFVALLTAWVTMVFVPSALIVLIGVPNAMTRPGVGSAGALAATWRVADEMGPVPKLVLIAALGALVWLGAGGGRRPTTSQMSWASFAQNSAIGVGAMLLTLAVIPAAYTRGFGVGLSGVRFDPAVLPLYVVGAVVGGTAFTVSLARCAAR